MKSSDLEVLITYLDDELDAGQRAAIEARLEVNAELARALATLRANDALLAEALRQAEAEAGEAGIADRIERLVGATEPVRRTRPAGRAPWLALAASLAALALGIGLGMAISGQRFEARLARLEAARADEAQAIERVVTLALEKQLSGQAARWQSRETGRRVVVTPVRTFRAESGKWCREFIREIEGGGSHEALRGIACRDGDGAWRPQLWRPAASS